MRSRCVCPQLYEATKSRIAAIGPVDFRDPRREGGRFATRDRDGPAGDRSGPTGGRERQAGDLAGESGGRGRSVRWGDGWTGCRGSPLTRSTGISRCRSGSTGGSGRPARCGWRPMSPGSGTAGDEGTSSGARGGWPGGRRRLAGGRTGSSGHAGGSSTYGDPWSVGGASDVKEIVAGAKGSGRCGVSSGAKAEEPRRSLRCAASGVRGRSRVALTEGIVRATRGSFAPEQGRLRE